MFSKAPLFLLSYGLLHLFGSLPLLGAVPLVDLAQLHLPQSPVEWGVFVATVFAFLFIRRSDKQVIQRTVRAHVKLALAAALAGQPSAATPSLLRRLFGLGGLDAKRLPKSRPARRASLAAVVPAPAPKKSRVRAAS